MNALHYRKFTRSQRELSNRVTEFVVLASLIVLHDDFGFGVERADKFVRATSAIIDEYSDRYGADCLLAALQSKARDKGIIVE